MSGEDRPFTVLVFNPMGGDGWGGVERWFMDLALGMRSRGVRVLSVGRPDALWTRRCMAEGFETRATPMRGDFSLGEARAVAFWMQEQGVDVVCTKLHKGIRLGGLAARFAGHKPVVAFMGLVEVEKGWRYRLTYRFFLHRIVTLSEGMRKGILDVGSGVPPEHVVAIPYGVDVAAYQPAAALAAAARTSLGAGPSDRLVVAVGRLHEQKRFDLLLEAFAAAPAGTRLAIVGTGSLQGDLEAKAKSLGVAGRVRFAGFRSDVPAVLAAADLFALSSDDEGLPMVVLEAMASARAVVATDVGSVRDLVEDGETGLVVPRRDPAALGAAMAALLEDDGRRRRMGKAGRARVAERYPVERCVAETEAYLRRTAGREAATSPPPRP
jgi:glycosyltransferase involved in cell wall biosynthesis